MNMTTGRRIAAMLGATSLILFTLPGMAQTPTALPTSQEEFEKQVGITPDQHKKLTVVDDKYKPQLKKIQDKYEPQFKQLQQQLQALQQKYAGLQQKAFTEAKPVLQQRQKDVEAVLTPAQREKIKQINAAAQAQRGAMMGGGAAGAGAMHP